MKRRTLLQLAPALASGGAWPQQPKPQLKRIPSSGEEIPAVGLGTWITFNVGDDAQARAASAEVMRQFFAAGGRLIDSSPMYGSSQGVIGEGLHKLGMPRQAFAADKVWTSGNGPAQIEASRQLWRVPRFDLLQVHNLLAWERQLPVLQAMKAAGQLRYVGISTSEGRRHAEVEQMFGHIEQFLNHWLEPLARDHRSYVTVAIGCTGGQHRSVYLVERLAQSFGARWTALKRHRELDAR